MSPLFASGLELMLVGMGTVFVFLTLLVVATHGMSTLIQRYLPPAATAPAGPRQASAETAGAPHEEEIAAITVAIREHLKQPVTGQTTHQRERT